MADERHVQFARELAERDERLAADLATLRALQADVEELRAHSEAAARFRAAFADERTRLDEAVAAAVAALRAREAEATAAEAELAQARKGEAEAAARRAVTRTTDAAASARRKLERLGSERDVLDADAARHEAERPRLEHRQAQLSARLAAAPRISLSDPPEAESPTEWSSRARAALFVAVGSLESERDRVVREANELAASTLGDAMSATSVRLAADRIEQAAESGTMPASPS
jgi:chromosome segregation ATPase